MRSRSLVLAASALACVLPVRAAHAGSADAWTAAKANLPKDTMVLLGLDLAQLQRSSLWSLGFPLIMSQQPDIKAALDTVKTSCQLDPLKVVQSIVIGTDEKQEHGAIFIAVSGVDQAKLTSCFSAVAKTKADVKTDGKITELKAGDKSVYVTWVGANVIAVPFELTSKTDLQTWSSGAKGLAKAKVAKGMGKVNTAGAVWAVSAVPKELDDKMKMKMGYGAVTMASGKLGADLHIQLGSAADAKTAADKAQKELANLAASPDLAANLKSVVTGVTVTSAGDELAVKGAMPEADVMSLVMTLMK